MNRLATYLFFWVGASLSMLWAQEGVQPENQAIAQYLYDFAKNIEWPNSDQTTYRFHALSNDTDLNEALVDMARARRINNKPIQISTGSKAGDIPNNIDLLFVLDSYNQLVPEVFLKIRNRPILLVTDHFAADQYTMINFFDDNEGELSFEINPGNIERQKLIILPTMSILGGKIISEDRLYLAERARANQMNSELRSFRNRIDSLQDRLKELDDLNKIQSRQLKYRNQEYLNSQNLLKASEIQLNKLESDILSKQKELERENQKLQELDVKNRDRLTELTRQQRDLEEQRRTLANLNQEIEDREDELKLAGNQLSKLDNKVTLQQNALVSLLMVVGLIIILAVLLFVGYRDKQRTNERLEAQKEELTALLDELHKTQSQLVQSEKMASLGTLTAGIAHEINNAINFVYSGVHILNKNFADVAQVIDELNKINPKDKDLKSKLAYLEEVKKENYFDDAYQAIPGIIDNVKIGAERTTGIVKGLRTFSRTNQEEKTMVNIHKDLDLALLLLQGKYRDNITIEKDYDETIPKIQGFEGELNQAFVNLINNAIDAINETDKEGSILLKTRLQENEVIISVKDSGVGISQEDAEKIFDPFFTTKKIGVGTGLGLSITYGIIDKHGGTITVDSEKNVGTEFRISLPLDPETVQPNV